MTVAAPALQRVVAGLWQALGVAAGDAALVAEALVEANLQGHDSHGVIRVTQWIDHLQRGWLRPGAAIAVTAETPALVALDGGWNFGLLVAREATRRAVDKALAVGVGVATVRAAHHIGRLADYCRQAAEAGCLAHVVANNHGQAAAVAPWGGRERRLSTNPMAYGFPRAAGAPILVDVTTAVAPEGKVRVLQARGEQAPEGWLLDAAGRPTRDPASFYASPPGSILPLGGTMGHKGYGLSVAVELLAGAFSGGGCTRTEPVDHYGNAATITVWSPAALGDAEDFLEAVEALVASLKSSPRQPGVAEILLPGEIESRCRAQRLVEGIPLDEATWTALTALAHEHGVPLA